MVGLSHHEGDRPQRPMPMANSRLARVKPLQVGAEKATVVRAFADRCADEVVHPALGTDSQFSKCRVTHFRKIR